MVSCGGCCRPEAGDISGYSRCQFAVIIRAVPSSDGCLHVWNGPDLGGSAICVPRCLMTAGYDERHLSGVLSCTSTALSRPPATMNPSGSDIRLVWSVRGCWSAGTPLLSRRNTAVRTLLLLALPLRSSPASDLLILSTPLLRSLNPNWKLQVERVPEEQHDTNTTVAVGDFMPALFE